MNKQLVQKIVEVYNKVFELEHIYMIIESKGYYYNCYEEVALQSDLVIFVDDDNHRIILEYKDIDSVKVSVI